jgi:hypothetical protein
MIDAVLLPEGATPSELLLLVGALLSLIAIVLAFLARYLPRPAKRGEEGAHCAAMGS